jgi:uncharacterized protein YdiU (UPF0061 family)
MRALLADHAIDAARSRAEGERRTTRRWRFFEGVVADRQAALVVRWMLRRLHPWRDEHRQHDAISAARPSTTAPAPSWTTIDPRRRLFSSIDHHGPLCLSPTSRPSRHWNLARLAEALLAILDENEDKALEAANAAVTRFMERFQEHWKAVIRAKTGLGDAEQEIDQALIRDLLAILYEQKADYTLAFRRLADAAEDSAADAALGELLEDPNALTPWLAAWRDRLSQEGVSPEARAAQMRKVNPAFIPRNHKVEEALNAAIDHGDFSLFEALNDLLARPYEDQPAFAAYAEPPRPGEEITATFCGT